MSTKRMMRASDQILKTFVATLAFLLFQSWRNKWLLPHLQALRPDTLARQPLVLHCLHYHNHQHLKGNVLNLVLQSPIKRFLHLIIHDNTINHKTTHTNHIRFPNSLLNSPTTGVGHRGASGAGLSCPIGRMSPIGSLQHRGTYVIHLVLSLLLLSSITTFCRANPIDLISTYPQKILIPV